MDARQAANGYHDTPHGRRIGGAGLPHVGVHGLRCADVFDKNPRAKTVLQIAAEQSGWGKPLPAGQGRSIAPCIGFGSLIAQVVEVSVER